MEWLGGLLMSLGIGVIVSLALVGLSLAICAGDRCTGENATRKTDQELRG